jgi:hypothetical protein
MGRWTAKAPAWAMKALPALVLAACSTSPAVRTTHLRGDITSPVTGGVTYYLPKRVLKLGVWETREVVTNTIDLNKVEVVEGEPRHFATILEIQTVPDRNYLMRLTHEPSAAFHDNVQVTVTTQGMLKEVATKFKDEGPAIVAKLAELATLLAQAPTALAAPSPKAAVGSVSYEVRTRLLRTLIVDPTDASSHQWTLAPYGIRLSAQPLPAGAEACCTLDEQEPCEPLCAESGVCYRPVIPYQVTIQPGGVATSGSAFELPDGFEEVVLLPNRSPIVCLPIDRTPFVESEFRATFEEGLLTSVHSDKPSEILGFLEIPIRVAKAIVGIPGELLQFRVTHYDRVQKAAAGEQAAFKAIEDLSKARQDGY